MTRYIIRGGVEGKKRLEVLARVMWPGNVEINPRDIMTREAIVFGVLLWRVPEADESEIHAALQAGLGNGILRPVIASGLPLASAPEAHRRRVMEVGARGKIVLIP